MENGHVHKNKCNKDRLHVFTKKHGIKIIYKVRNTFNAIQSRPDNKIFRHANYFLVKYRKWFHG